MKPNDPPVELGPELDFLRTLWALDHALQKCSKRMSRVLGVTGPQRLALRLVGRFPGLPAGRLARMLHLHPSTITGVVKRLSEHGLIVRSSDDPDRRRSLLRITPAGQALLARTQPAIEFAVTAAISALPDEQVETTRNTLIAVTRKLEGMQIAATEPEPTP